MSPRSAGSALVVAGAVVLVANAGLLVLQLAAGRLLSPFVGSSLETWTAVIGAFLGGIAVGNGLGGRWAGRTGSRGGLALALAAGAVAAAWVAGLPALLHATGWQKPVPVGIRIPLLAALAGLPPAFTLSLLTPAAVRLGLRDVRRAGRVAGLVFSLGTLGSLAGNYATGFLLVPHFTLNAIVLGVAATLLVTAAAAWLLLPRESPASPAVEVPGVARPATGPQLSMARACGVAAACSFAAMALELAAARLLAQVVGVSLYTWTGVIGVMLAGTAAGNALGGVLADRAAARGGVAGRERLAYSLGWASALAAQVLVLFALLVNSASITSLALPWRVVAWTFALFFLPMLAFGTVSPQAVRLAVADAADAGRTAGRVYAWSTAGAILGTFATGYVLISGVGMFRTVLLAAAVPGLLTPLLVSVHKTRALLYGQSLVFGGVATAWVAIHELLPGIARETNYYTIRVVEQNTPADGPVLALQLDLLTHSCVKPADPTYIYYAHERTQLDFTRAAGPGARVLVIGGGGYTYPRCALTEMPETVMDVVEIDPGVTATAYDRLALDPTLPITTVNRDGRLFLEDDAAAGAYDLVTLDAVNDYAIPAHLLTRECNDAVKRALAPGGVYLVTVIDLLNDGPLWKAVFVTLRLSFAHVELLTPHGEYDPETRQVFVIYASDTPLTLPPGATATHRIPADEVERLLRDAPPPLTDQFAPVDQMMLGVFRTR
jgi:MFS family permease